MGNDELQRVTFDQGKSLKAIGFNLKGRTHFHADGKLFQWSLSKENHNSHPDEVSAPTVALALKWAWDVHRVYVQMIIMDPEWEFYFGWRLSRLGIEVTGRGGKFHRTQEGAQSEALDAAIREIKKVQQSS